VILKEPILDEAVFEKVVSRLDKAMGDQLAADRGLSTDLSNPNPNGCRRNLQRRRLQAEAHAPALTFRASAATAPHTQGSSINIRRRVQEDADIVQGASSDPVDELTQGTLHSVSFVTLP
jgi:hypothetical protein